MRNSELGRILEENIEEIFPRGVRENTSKTFAEISSRYRAESGSFLQTEAERLVYLFTRLPGTFSAVEQVLEEVRKRSPEFSPRTVLDVGSGPGTASWAAFECFDSPDRYVLLEKDPGFISIGKKLARFSPRMESRQSWHCSDMKNGKFEPSDLILFSYSLGETDLHMRPEFFEKIWEATKGVLVIIEPGTPSGYAKLMRVRNILIELGAFLWAPCPHADPCPLPKGDWCHFSVRVSRSSFHRKCKSAELGYEDEKFCYLIFGKMPSIPISSRVIRRPVFRPGLVELTLCGKDGIKKEVFSKKAGDLYKIYKKTEWGDGV